MRQFGCRVEIGLPVLSISKPLSAGQARTYHAREFASSEQNYWSRDQQGHSEWQGRLSGEWGLSGAVGAEHFARLSEGQHPNTQEQLVRRQVSKTYEGKNGKEITSVEHRAGWDATFPFHRDAVHSDTYNPSSTQFIRSGEGCLCGDLSTLRASRRYGWFPERQVALMGRSRGSWSRWSYPLAILVPGVK